MRFQRIMTPLAKYIVQSSIFSAGAIALTSLAFFVGASVFSTPNTKSGVNNQTSSQLTTIGQAPSSHLAGAPTATVNRSSIADSSSVSASRDWVEVTDDVNMRNGPTKSSDILGVKAKGTRLHVFSREASWIGVVEPETGEKGWIYENFVENVHPTTQEAELAGETPR
jgi:uncharacterized protein YgiM (DUF1202 family)